MMHVRKTCFVFALSSLLTNTGCQKAAKDNSDYYKVNGTTPIEIPTNQYLNGERVNKTILINNVVTTNSFQNHKDEMKQLGETALTGELDYSEGIIPFSESPGAVDLGMNQVPVLDQGQYGTCVTFATTALLDAIIGEGDAISQQCSLALNKQLGHDYWNGAQNALQILRPLRTYGVVEKSKCTSQYPDASLKISSGDYQRYTTPRMNVGTVTGNFIEPITLNMVRSALNNNHRIVLGFGIKKNASLSIPVSGFNMKVGNKNTVGGLWACSQNGSINYCGSPTAGHAIVVIGYDDTQQLLKIRNSWSEIVGDNGDYYMTYRFFELMSFNGTEVY